MTPVVTSGTMLRTVWRASTRVRVQMHQHTLSWRIIIVEKGIDRSRSLTGDCAEKYSGACVPLTLGKVKICEAIWDAG